jgi:hypothetical protein
MARDRGWADDPFPDYEAEAFLERAIAIATAELAVLKGEDHLPEVLQTALYERFAVEAEQWLDDNCTPEGYTMGWNDLSFYFQPDTWWAETPNGRPDEY